MAYKMHRADGTHISDATGHPRRCVGKRRNGEQCGNFGLLGTYPPKCNIHASKLVTRASIITGVRQRKMPRLYEDHISGRLSELMHQELGSPTEEQFSVLEELALMRAHASQFIKVFNTAYNGLQQDPGNEKLEAVCLQAGTMMSEVLTEVSALAEKASKIHFASKGTFTTWDIRRIVNQTVRIMYEVCGTEHMDLARQFDVQLEERLRLPQDGTSGTQLTPDMDVADMDNTIPKEPK